MPPAYSPRGQSGRVFPTGHAADPTGPSLRKGCAVLSLLATTTRSASLVGSRGLHGVAAYTAGLRWAGAPKAASETFPALAASLSSIAVLPHAGDRPPAHTHFFGERIGHRAL